MKSLVTLLCLTAALLIGCGDGHDDHKDHDHDKETKDKDGEMHGDAHKLKTVTAGAFTVNVTQFGHIELGKEGHFDITLEGGEAAAVRVWVGTEDKTKWRSSKAERTDNGFHAHADVPADLPADAKLWLEIETDDGETVTASLEFLKSQ